MIYRAIPETLCCWVSPELWHVAQASNPPRPQCPIDESRFYRTLAGLVVMTALGREHPVKPARYATLDRRRGAGPSAPLDGGPVPPFTEFELGDARYIVAAETPGQPFARLDRRGRRFSELGYDYVLPCRFQEPHLVSIFQAIPAAEADTWHPYLTQCSKDLADCQALTSLADLPTNY